jgi:hypothetical protein
VGDINRQALILEESDCTVHCTILYLFFIIGGRYFDLYINVFLLALKGLCHEIVLKNFDKNLQN